MSADLLPIAFLVLVVATIGCAVGFAEIISRYRDQPFRVARYPAALLYYLINGGVGVLALALYIIHLELDPTAFSDAKLWVEAMTIAGFGGAVFLRSRLTTISGPNGDVAVGPAILVDSLLSALDRSVDRHRAIQRHSFVNAKMQDVGFERAKTVLPPYCLSLMQATSQEDELRLALAVERIAQTELQDDLLRGRMLGLQLLVLVGEDLLSTVLEDLAGTLSPIAPAPSVVDRLLSQYPAGKVEQPLLDAVSPLLDLSTDDRISLQLKIVEAITPLSERREQLSCAILLLQDEIGADVTQQAIDRLLATDATATTVGAG